MSPWIDLLRNYQAIRHGMTLFFFNGGVELHWLLDLSFYYNSPL